MTVVSCTEWSALSVVVVVVVVVDVSVASCPSAVVVLPVPPTVVVVWPPPMDAPLCTVLSEPLITEPESAVEIASAPAVVVVPLSWITAACPVEMLEPWSARMSPLVTALSLPSTAPSPLTMSPLLSPPVTTPCPVALLEVLLPRVMSPKPRLKAPFCALAPASCGGLSNAVSL